MGTQLREVRCPSGKQRHRSEAGAIQALIRVRKHRIQTGDPLDHESHIYPCEQCNGWHLSSKEVLHSRHLIPDKVRHDGETWEAYARRLERRIKEQRAQIMSMIAVGHGGNNRQARKRIASLTVALGRVTELWDEERRNREAVVERLRELEKRPVRLTAASTRQSNPMRRIRHTSTFRLARFRLCP